MAKWYTVKAGDTLWDIAERELGSATRYYDIYLWNELHNPNYIWPGLKLILEKPAPKAPPKPKKIFDLRGGALTSNPNRLYVEWKCATTAFGGYTVQIIRTDVDGHKYYSTEDVKKVAGLGYNQAYMTYDLEDSTYSVELKIKPYAQTNPKTEKPYWTDGEYTSFKYTHKTPLTRPSRPDVEVKDYTITATLSNIDIPGATEIEFQVYQNGTKLVSSGSKSMVKITVTNSASYTYTGTPGNTYVVRCRACNKSKKYYSDWSDWSDGTGTVPKTPSGITTLKASDETAVYLKWSASTAAETYWIQYATKKEYFDKSSGVYDAKDIEGVEWYITGLETGTEWFFRLKACNSSGESGWTEIKSIILGSTPTAPTTWSSATTAMRGDIVTLYWVHNSEDASSQTRARIQWWVDGVEQSVINKTFTEDDEENVSFHDLDTSSYQEGVVIEWRVCTAGVTEILGEYSTKRSITVYAPVELELSVTNMGGESFDELTSFPIGVYAVAGPKTQNPTGYSLVITSNELYETVDDIGNSKTVNTGEEVYSRYFDISDALDIQISAGDVDLENTRSYTITCTVAMNSGLTAEKSITFSVSWSEESYTPEADISIDTDSYTAAIRPYCVERYYTGYRVDNSDSITDEVVDLASVNTVSTETGESVLLGLRRESEVMYCVRYFEDSIDGAYYLVNSKNGVYTVSSTIVDEESIDILTTESGEEIKLGRLANGSVVRYCEVVESRLIDGVLLAVYRREFDGSFTKIESNIPNSDNSFVTDPHPALDYARYRIVATTQSTGAVGYYDAPAVEVGGKAIIIQWAEEWSTFDVNDEGDAVEPSWVGSMLVLPYNIDVSDSNSSDVSLIEYIGRSHPIAYYGTQLGESATWSVSVEKNDEETIYSLRRLAKWMGDVYVREPSGTGYWANVAVSFSQKHTDLVVPVTINITRVEGGV